MRRREIPVDSRITISVLGDSGRIDPEQFQTMPGVAETIPIYKPFRLAGRDFRSENTVVKVGGDMIGGREIAIIAGPCSVENRDQLLRTAEAVKSAGAQVPARWGVQTADFALCIPGFARGRASTPA